MPRLPTSETPHTGDHVLATGGMIEGEPNEVGSIKCAASIRANFPLLLIAAALASGVFLIWQTAGSLLMIFGGLLLAALLDAAGPAPNSTGHSA